MSRAPQLDRVLACLAAVLISIALVSPHIAEASNRVELSIVGGPRTAHASDVEFDAPVLLDGRLVQYGTATISIDDASGTGLGWQVLLGQAGADAPQSDAGEPAPALLSVSPVTRIAGQDADAQGGPDLPPTSVTGELRQLRIIASAEPGFGMGTYQLTVTVAREVSTDPSDSTRPLTLAVMIVAGQE